MSIFKEDVRFKIVSIQTERTPNGKSKIEFTTAEESLIKGNLFITIPNKDLDDKIYIKAIMMGAYDTALKFHGINDKVIRVGDVI